MCNVMKIKGFAVDARWRAQLLECTKVLKTRADRRLVSRRCRRSDPRLHGCRRFRLWDRLLLYRDFLRWRLGIVNHRLLRRSRGACVLKSNSKLADLSLFRVRKLVHAVGKCPA